MLANPRLPAYHYNPYNKKITKESYDHQRMRATRAKAIEEAKSATRFGLILGKVKIFACVFFSERFNLSFFYQIGTLGRQGSPPVVRMLEKRIADLGYKSYIILLSEVFPEKLALFGDQVDVWIQV